MSPLDVALLERWQSGRDAEAFAEIVSRYAGMVFATARRILHNPTDAEEVSQECFLYLARGKVRITSSLGGWLLPGQRQVSEPSTIAISSGVRP